MSRIFGISCEELPGGLGWASEELTAVTHAGTHMDAPWHYGPLAGGRPARTIEEIPLEWCCGAGIVLDLRHKGDGEEISVSDLAAALAAAGRRLRPHDIVLLWTGADRHWGESDYPERGAGLCRESTLWLLEQGVRVIGTDAWGLDRPFGALERERARTAGAGAVWAAHFAGHEREYCQLEKLTNLQLLPFAEFQVICFPIKIARASAAWVRAVAVLDGESGR